MHGSKTSIADFIALTQDSLRFIQSLPPTVLEPSKKLAFFHKAALSMGHTALCLSGGGSLGMYHMGVVKALIDQHLYEHIHIVSGASGGSLVAAMCATRTQAELLETVTGMYRHTSRSAHRPREHCYSGRREHRLREGRPHGKGEYPLVSHSVAAVHEPTLLRVPRAQYGLRADVYILLGRHYLRGGI
jgi:hypothetical protein